MRKSSPLLLILTYSLALPVFAADNVVEEIVARVNNQIVTRGDFQRSQQQLRDELQQQDAAHADKLYTEREKDVLRDLIDQQLLLEKGKDLSITADTELIKKLDEMRKEMNLESMEELEKKATEQGVAFEDFKQNLRNQIITEQVIGREVGSRMAVSKEEEQQFYDAHKAQLEQPEAVRLSEILIAIPAGGDSKDDKKPDPNAAPDPQQIEAAKAKAEAVLTDIRKGTSFEDAAKKSSNGPSAAQGGDLGYFVRGKLAKELEDKTFAMKAGDVSEVTRTRQGFVILKVTEHPKEGIPPLKDIEPRVQDALYREKLQPALRAYLTKLREDAYIKLAPGYTDSGASANETLPVEAEGKVPQAKKLKKKKKFLVI